MHPRAMTLDGIELVLPEQSRSTGGQVLNAILAMADRAIDRLRSESSTPFAAFGRLRGTGRGVHFRDL
ncbi:MAG: hypothetical protein AAB403_01320, partial [Planctomycetota bacterium]